MDQLDILFYFVLSMSERAKISVLTFVDIFWVVLTEFSLVAVNVIELLKFIMRVLTVFEITLIFGTAEMAILKMGRAPLVFVIVVVKACFPLMLI